LEYQLRQHDQSRPEPNSQHDYENVECHILEMRRCVELNDAAKYVCDVVQEGNRAADSEVVSVDHAEVKGASRDMMQLHLVKI
jgi:hypothetical protein